MADTLKRELQPYRCGAGAVNALGKKGDGVVYGESYFGGA
jgi:hypothetical protein